MMTSTVFAGGISVDAGLTPAEDRWIFRTQLRHMERSHDPAPMNRKMEVNVWNNVLAYGLRRNLTLMVRQPYMWRKMSMMGSSVSKSGMGDFMVMGKYGLYRKNTADYTLGVAATMGLELPTGSDAFSSDTWDLKPGLFMSWRNGTWASDVSIAYKWNGFAGDNSLGIDPGDELELDFALARQFSVGASADVVFAPVLEVSYRDVSATRLMGQGAPNSGESVLFLSPGAKLTVSSFILEALVQFPVSQSQKGVQTERDTGYILGVRYMF
jgi:hypothetical protein